MKFTAAQKAELAKLTPFEREVLMACASIAEGETRSYSEVAKMIGEPNSMRAVGNALAKNPLAPLIPCHRVVRKDGTVGGYSGAGGKNRKETLLRLERRKR